VAVGAMHGRPAGIDMQVRIGAALQVHSFLEANFRWSELCLIRLTSIQCRQLAWSRRR
jgi:hypothetical protein